MSADYTKGWRDATAAAAKVAQRHAFKWQTLAVDELDKANDADAHPDHVWRRDAHQHKCMGSVGIDISEDLLALTPPTRPEDDPSDPAFYSVGQTGVEPALPPPSEACVTCNGTGDVKPGASFIRAMGEMRKRCLDCGGSGRRGVA